MNNPKPFDWHRMFLGDESNLFMLEIVFRTAFFFVFTFIMIRFIGKRMLGQLSPFELIVIVALGSCVGDPMLQPSVPLLHGMVAVTVLVSLHSLLGRMKP